MPGGCPAGWRRATFAAGIVLWSAIGSSAAVAPEGSRACPAGLDAVATCHVGQDANGAWWLAATPREWSGVLLVHAHGGPRLGVPRAEDATEDLERFADLVRLGHAWVGSTYRRGGYGVRMAAEDVESSRLQFIARFGKPRVTILHGQSYGGNVAAKLAELAALEPETGPRYHGVLLTSGVLQGGDQAYGFRADLRAVYQYYCGNHPAKAEQRYPLWQGLPLDSSLTREQLRQRVDDCTGAGLPAAKRTADQQRNLDNITRVVGIEPGQLLSHLGWATFTFQDLVLRRLGGNPFDNADREYRGSTDDVALNAGVERFRADRAALARLAYDAAIGGHLAVPTVTLHGLHDPVVSVEASRQFASRVDEAGSGHLLLSLFTDEREHSRLASAGYVAALDALLDWVGSGQRPAVVAVGRRCEEWAVRSGKGPCKLVKSP
jgi:hypothetical protein